jgi:hypothetical protein
MMVTCLVGVLMSILMAGCTRPGKSGSISLSIPIANRSSLRNFSVGAVQSTTPTLKTLLVNVQISGQATIYKKFEYSDGGAPESVQIDIPNIDIGTKIFIQGLGVFTATSGALQLEYSDATFAMDGNPVTLQLAAIGGATKQSFLAGRIKINGQFPTGTLVAQLSPPGGAPKMTVDKTFVLAGWFKVFALNGDTKIDYLWQEAGTNVFTGLNSDFSSEFDLTESPPAYRVKIHQPSSYSRDSSQSISSSQETEYVLGYFGDPAYISNNTVCYPKDVYEAVPGQYAASVDLPNNPFVTPLDINFAIPNHNPLTTSASIELEGGGLGALQGPLYTNASALPTACKSTDGTAMVVHHTLIGRNNDNFAGFNGPFQVIDAFSQNDSNFVSAIKTGAGIALNYSFLPGVSSGTSINANLTAGSSVITVTSSSFNVGSLISGTGIPDATYIVSSTWNSTDAKYLVTLSQPASLSISEPVKIDSIIDGVDLWVKYSISVTGTLTSGSSLISNVATVYLQAISVNMPISDHFGALPDGTVVTAIDPTNHTITVSNAATASQSSAQLTINQRTGGGNNDCANLATNGYQLVQKSIGNPFTFTGVTVGGNALSATSSIANFNFALCPVRAGAYVGNYVRGQLSGDTSNSNSPFGWANANATTGYTSGDFSGLGGASARVTAVTSSAGYTELTVGSTDAVSFPASSEVLLRVAGTDATNTSCAGVVAGVHMPTGQYAFARVINTTSATIQISKGSFVDSVISDNLNSVTQPFCYLQAIRVPHFRTLSIAGALSTASFHYQYNNNGVIAFRVNGALKLDGADISASGHGYSEGVSTDRNAAGLLGPRSANFTLNNSGGQAGDLSGSGGGGGGGGYGVGAPSSLTLGGVGSPNVLNNFALVFGGGGGAGQFSALENDGGTGGGIVFIAANNIFVIAPTTIEASGLASAATAAPGGGGGGGGGIDILANNIVSNTGSSVLTLKANGGNGVYGGGGGGGGFIGVQACDVTNAHFSSSVQAGSTNAGVGYYAPSDPLSVYNWCQ